VKTLQLHIAELLESYATFFRQLSCSSKLTCSKKALTHSLLVKNGTKLRKLPESLSRGNIIYKLTLINYCYLSVIFVEGRVKEKLSVRRRRLQMLHDMMKGRDLQCFREHLKIEMLEGQTDDNDDDDDDDDDNNHDNIKGNDDILVVVLG